MPEAYGLAELLRELRNSALAWVTPLRPQQWVKNSFVLAGVLFQPGTSANQVVQAFWLFFAFCLLSAAVYIGNDFIDRDADRQHSFKRHRPLASGRIAPMPARLLALVLVGLGVGLSAAVGSTAAWMAGMYLVLQLAYSLKLKHVPVVELTCTVFRLDLFCACWSVQRVSKFDRRNGWYSAASY